SRTGQNARSSCREVSRRALLRPASATPSKTGPRNLAAFQTLPHHGGGFGSCLPAGFDLQQKRLAYNKDCPLYFLSHGQRPTLVAPHRKPDTVHLHQYAANSGADPQPLLPSVEEEIL